MHHTWSYSKEVFCYTHQFPWGYLELPQVSTWCFVAWEPCFLLPTTPRICPPLLSRELNTGRWQEECPWGLRSPTLLQEGAGAHAVPWGSPGGTHFRNSQAHSTNPYSFRGKKHSYFKRPWVTCSPSSESLLLFKVCERNIFLSR